MLVLLFVTYVSDKYANDPHALIEIPPRGSFADMLRAKGDKEIGDRLNKIVGRLADANDNLKGAITEQLFEPKSHERGGEPENVSEVVTVGIDVAQASRRVALDRSGPVAHLTNELEGHAALMASLPGKVVELIVLAATGSYEVAVAGTLPVADFPLAHINPQLARDVAKALENLAQAGRIDARVVAQLAEVLARHPDRDELVKPLPSAEAQQLQA